MKKVAGDLDIHIMFDPMGEYDESKGDRYLQLKLEGQEWIAIFFDVLGCSDIEYPINGKGSEFYIEQLKNTFQQTLTDYPMLGRIYDTYQDTMFKLTEVDQLLNECKKVYGSTNNQTALNGVRKLIVACNEAIKNRMGLFLASD
jgi:hypothetical protein